MRTLLAGLFLSAVAFAQPLVLDCTQPQIVSFTSANTRFNLQFNGQQGEAVLIRFIPVAGTITQGFGITTPVLRDQFGNRLSARTPDNAPLDIIGSPNGRIGYHYDLPGDGTYTVEVASANPAATATIQVALTRVNRPCTGATLTCGRSVPGNLAASARMDTYQYAVRSGDTISFRIIRTGSFVTRPLYYLAVYGPDGTVLNAVGNRLPAFDGAGRTDVTATTDGNLTIAIWEASASIGGGYYVSGIRLNGGCGGPGLSCSSALDGQLNTPLSYASYTLSVSPADVYQIRLGRADTSGSFAVGAEIYDPQGKLVGTVNAGNASGHAPTSSVVKFTNPGTYAVLVSGPTDGSAGTFSIATTRINRPCTDTTISCAATLDDSVSGVVRNRVYALNASANDTFLVRLLEPGSSLFRPQADILDSNGNSLLSIRTTDLARATFTAPADGTYTMLVADTYDGGQSGNYTLSVIRLNRPCNATPLSCGGVVSGNLSRPLDAGVFTWNASPSESFSVRMLGGSGGVLPSTEVYDPAGAAVGTGFTGGSGGVDVVNPAGGSYTILALDNNKTPTAGSYSIDLLRTKNACAAALPQAQTASGVVSASTPFAAYTMTASQGDRLALRSASVTAGFSAQMELYDPDGRRLDSNVFALNRSLTASGVYTAIVGAASPRTAGGFALVWQLMNRPAGVDPLACGSSTSGSLAGANQFHYYKATLASGDTVRLLFTRLDSSTAQMEFFDPTGVRLTATSDVLQKVNTAGDYLVLVSPSTTTAEIASYTVAFQRPNNPCSPTALTCGQTTLKLVQVPGQLDTFAFNGIGGDLHTIRLTGRSGNYTPLAELYSPAGARIVTSSTGQIRMVIPADGTYALLVRDGGSVNLGSYRVNLQDDSATCPVDDKEAPAITLVRPTGGEVLPGGTVYRVQWVSDDNVGIASHDLALSTDGGKTFPTTIASGISGNAQTYDWLLPLDIKPTRTAAVRVTATDAAGNAQSAASDLLTAIGSGFTPNSTANYTYDSLNRLILASLGSGRTVTWVWDAAGNLVQISAQ